MDLPIIKHLVICGGGISGITAYSILKESNNYGTWSIENIQSIYGTSAGAIIAVFIALKYDWKDIDDYIVKRPWQNVFKFDIGTVLRSFDARGIFDRKIIEEMVVSLLKGKDLETTITMKELYEYSNIDIHIFTTEVHTYSTIDISHRTHPEWSVIDALYCSACLPIIFSPFLKEGKCYVDGGVTNNYPIYSCLENGAIPSEILGISIHKDETTKTVVTESSSLFDYLSFILGQMYKHSQLSNIKPVKYEIAHEIKLENALVSLYDFSNISSSQEQRYLLLEKGIQIWKNYITTHTNAHTNAHTHAQTNTSSIVDGNIDCNDSS